MVLTFRTIDLCWIINWLTIDLDLCPAGTRRPEVVLGRSPHLLEGLLKVQKFVTYRRPSGDSQGQRAGTKIDYVLLKLCSGANGPCITYLSLFFPMVMSTRRLPDSVMGHPWNQMMGRSRDVLRTITKHILWIQLSNTFWKVSKNSIVTSNSEKYQWAVYWLKKWFKQEQGMMISEFDLRVRWGNPFSLSLNKKLTLARIYLLEVFN